MSILLVQDRLKQYNCKTVIDQENALKEIMQEIALMYLSRAGFFSVASFQGGTCLRILYKLERFSEDLDFALDIKDPNFTWDKYIHGMQEEFNAYGFDLEVKPAHNQDKVVKYAFLKTTSTGGVLVINDRRSNKPKIKIKLEIDTNPPSGATAELKYLDFPLPFAVKTHDLSSLFAGKCHALLYRGYVKGRDWYDFTWYVSRQTPINFKLLTQAALQNDKLNLETVIIKKEWFVKQLRDKVENINWSEAKQDVSRFLRPQQLDNIKLWSKEYFFSLTDKLEQYL